MSTQTAFAGFREADVAKLPKIACVGYVDDVGEGKVSQSGDYVVQPFTIRAHGPGKGTILRVLYRPEWLDAGFDPNTMPEEFGDKGRSMLAVYRNNIASKDRMTNLKGLAGSDENYNALAQMLITAEDKSVAGIQQILRDFFVNRDEPVDVGYVLKQRQDKTQDENGKTVYTLASGYEIGEWFHPTAENLKRKRQQAERSKDGSFQVAFDTEE